jgi:hypothetical protein
MEDQKLKEEMLSILDAELSIDEGIICNRFAAVSKIIEYWQSKPGMDVDLDKLRKEFDEKIFIPGVKRIMKDHPELSFSINSNEAWEELSSVFLPYIKNSNTVDYRDSIDNILSKFSDEVRELYHSDPMFNSCVNAMSRGTSPFEVIGTFVLCHEKMNKQISELISLIGNVTPKQKEGAGNG